MPTTLKNELAKMLFISQEITAKEAGEISLTMIDEGKAERLIKHLLRMFEAKCKGTTADKVKKNLHIWIKYNGLLTIDEFLDVHRLVEDILAPEMQILQELIVRGKTKLPVARYLEFLEKFGYSLSLDEVDVILDRYSSIKREGKKPRVRVRNCKLVASARPQLSSKA